MLHFVTYEISPITPWVTFVHGAGGSSSIWYKQIRSFREHFNVLLLDLRGHGKSKLPINTKLKKYTFDSIGDDVIEVLNHLKIAKSHFVGISLGTIIIREIAERHHDRVGNMILGGAVMKLNLSSQILMYLGVIFKSVLPYMVLYRLFAFVIMPRKKHKESRLLFINEAKKLYQKEFIRWFSLVSQVNPLLRLFRINDLGIPTLYIMGQEDHLFLPTIQKLVQGQSGSSRLYVVPQCGHVVNVEQPNIFNKVSLDFLRK